MFVSCDPVSPIAISIALGFDVSSIAMSIALRSVSAILFFRLPI